MAPAARERLAECVGPGEHGRAAREQNERRRRVAEVLDPERDAVRLDRRHHASTVAMTPPDVRNEWTVGYIMNLQGGVVDRWRGDGGTSYASPPVVCVAWTYATGVGSQRWTTGGAETHRDPVRKGTTTDQPPVTNVMAGYS
ncbi:hypothetical protein GCM10027259_00160 [Micromonospora palomenae]